MSEQIRSRILAALYEAPLDPRRWEEFLKLTASAVRGQAAALLVHDFHNTESAMSKEWGFHPDVGNLYAAHYGAIDVWRCAVTTSRDWIGTSERFVSFPKLLRTEFYNDLLVPYGIPHGIFAMVERTPSRVANLSICRSARAGPFEERDLEIVSFLKPHIQRAYQLHSELTAAHTFNGSLLAVLNEISRAIILLGSKMQIITMNKAAERTLAVKNGLRASPKGLLTEDAGESGRLERLVSEAIATSRGNGLGAAGAMTISRRDLPPLQVLVSPVKGFDIGSANCVRAIVFVSDPAQRVRPARDTLHAMFGLTPAECRVALLLGDGHAPRQIASMVGVTRNTVRSQIKSVFSKTGVKRQSELVRLLLHNSDFCIQSNAGS
ncbi:MAG TPA: helix-turn-helix transcriptional regulator [Candidatus Acidoferrales bacterium]|jgi:DNA-binding CsgD family transcriptional regulator|nr:helix-turn-helix transcriptional regulator [Candidatus Acidoferrales bacterium]